MIFRLINNLQAYAYDAQGRMSTLTTYKDASTPRVTTWNYNDRGFMTSKVYADSKGTGYTYTDDGQLASRTWARTYSGSPLVTSYTYDNAGRQLTVDYSDTTPDITYTYDWMGNISTVADAEGSRTFTYDYTTSGHPGLVSVTIPSILNHSINYTYDGYGRKTGMSLKNGSTPVFTNTYAYNSVTGRMATIGDGTYTANYTWQDGTGFMTQNQITRDSDSAVMTTHNRTYDTRTNNYHLLTTSNTTGSTTRTYTYVYNDKDQRTKLTLADGSYWEYTYDDKGQVVSGIKYDVNDNPVSGQHFGYDYDMIGNRVWEKDGSLTNQIDYTTNLVNQYTQLQPPSPAPAQNPTYDDDGNMLTNDGWAYTWNGENRMVQAVKTDDTKIEFKYDFMGRRFEKKKYSWVSSAWQLDSTLKFVYDGYKQIAEFDSNDNLQKTYTWQTVDLDVPLWVKDGSNYYYYIVDGNKNVRAMVDTSGLEVASYDYNPFGKTTSNGTYSSTNKFRFSSEYHDDETELVYYNYRYYDPELGRWINRDPIEEEGGANLYGLVGNDNVNEWDILGEKGKGHHIVPWSLFNKKVKKAVQEFFDSEIARIANDYYKIHNGKKLACISHPEYTKLVKEELEKFLGSKALKDMTLTEAEVFLNKIKNAKPGSKIAKFNEAVAKEAADAMKSALRKGTKKALGTATKKAIKKGAKFTKLGKAIPFIGTAITVAFVVDDINNKGMTGGLLNSTMDAIPLFGTGKIISEIITGIEIVEDER